jgi:hypothetical protein
MIMLMFWALCKGEAAFAQSPPFKIEDIVSKAENIGPVQYEVISTVSMIGKPLVQGFEESLDLTTSLITMRVLQKPPYMKIFSKKDGKEEVSIVHPDAYYVYDAVKDKYYAYDINTGRAVAVLAINQFDVMARGLQEDAMWQELGSEMVDGKPTTIVGYSKMEGETLSLKRYGFGMKGAFL